MAGLQRDNDPVIQEFHTWLATAQQVGSGCDKGSLVNRLFVPSTSVDAYLKEDRVERLIAAIFPDADPARSPEAAAIRGSHARIFCTLLSVGKGHFINHFIEHQLEDSKLPYTDRPSEFPRDSADPNFWKSFFEQQWQFSARRFHYQTGLNLDANAVLPFITLETIGNGGTGVTYKIKVHEDYDLLYQHDDQSSSTDDPAPHIYVLKTYRNSGAHTYYDNEVSAFKRLRIGGKPSPYVVRFFGSFVWAGTYNILLAYADQGTLEDFFKRTPPPSNGEDIVNFWDGLLSILKGLSLIHGTRESNTIGLQVLVGWHQDVKPDNILVKCQKQKSIYKADMFLADLGLSHFRKTISAYDGATDSDAHGTRTYGAPECYSRENDIENQRVEVKQTVDVWSAGCVLSEAAVWVVHGYPMLKEYRRRRKDETDRISGFTDRGCFHDGVKVLNTVSDIHGQILSGQDTRNSDYVTKEVLKMTDYMLVPSFRRLPAQSLCVISDNKIAEARDALSANTSWPFWTDGQVLNGPKAAAHSGPKTPPEVPEDYDVCSHGIRPSNERWPSKSQTVRHHKTTNNIMQSSQRSMTKDFSGSPRIYNDNGYTMLKGAGALFGAEEAHPLEKGKGKALLSEAHNQRSVSKTNRLQPNGATTWHQAQAISTVHARGYFKSTDLAPGNTSSDSSISRTKSQGSAELLMQAESRWRPSTPPGFRNSTTSTMQGLRANQEVTQLAERMTFLPRPESRSQKPEALDSKPPRLSKADALTWKHQQKELGWNNKQTDRLLDPLRKRDFAFLIDDSASMRPYWDEVKELFALLSYMVKKYDNDGIDLHFTMSSDKKRKKTTTPLKRMLEERCLYGCSNPQDRLGTLLEDYRKKLAESQSLLSSKGNFFRGPTELRRYNIYVFTDAVWQPRCNLEPHIRSMVDSLVQHDLYNAQIGIQFIRFGHNEEGIKRLDHLDSGLRLALDIVDTEPANGNVYKMILGAINPWFDDDAEMNDDNEGPAASAPRNNDHETRS